MPIKFSGAGATKLVNESCSVPSPKIQRNSWTAHKESVSRLPTLTPISDDEELRNGGCCVASPTPPKRSPLTENTIAPPPPLITPRGVSVEAEIYTTRPIPTSSSATDDSSGVTVIETLPSPFEAHSHSVSNLPKNTSNSHKRRSDAIYSINVDTWGNQPTVPTSREKIKRDLSSNDVTLKIDHSTDSNYYSELSREDLTKHRREVVRFKNGVTGFKLREYQRSNMYRMSNDDVKLFQFAIANIEKVQPRYQLRDAELALYSADPCDGFNPVFQSGSKKHKFLAIWQPGSSPEFIQRYPPSKVSYQKFFLVIGFLFLLAFLSCYWYVLITAVTDIVTNGMSKTGIKVNLESRGLLTLRMMLLGDYRDPYAQTGILQQE